ncbi:MAG: hypothetical protein ACREQ5_32920, partial [Candidatus Dormibacteria bacterium]
MSEPVPTTKTIHLGAWRRLALAAAALLPAALLISPHSAQAATASVALTRVTPCSAVCLAFTPGTLGVAAGDAVSWTDPAAAACTLRPTAAPDPAFLGGRLPGYAYLLRLPGTYTYHCAEYPAVHGTLTVVRAAVVPVAPAVVKPVAAKLPRT